MFTKVTTYVHNKRTWGEWQLLDSIIKLISPSCFQKHSCDSICVITTTKNYKDSKAAS